MAEQEQERGQEQGREQEQRQRQGQGKQRNWGMIGAALLLVASKGKSLLAILKFSKFGTAFISMFVTIGAYAIVFPFQFAVGLVVMILIHELGHVIAARQKGLPVSAPLFIPFLGALIAMKRNPRDAVTEAYIAFGGPILGTAGALAAFIAGVMFDSQILLVIANVGFFLNLINLLPIHPLDGGRISTAVTRWLWLVGLVGGLVVVIWLKSILFIIIWALFAWDLYGRYVKRKGRGKPANVGARIVVPLERLLAMGALIPGEEHRRDLNFNTFSSLDGEQQVRVYWEALGIDQVVHFPKGVQGLIHRIQVVQIENDPPSHPGQLVIHCQIDLETYEPDDYYEVPAATRLNYGVLYAALAAFLIFMLYAVHMQGIPSVV